MTPELKHTLSAADGLKSFLDDLLHPTRKHEEEEGDPGRPYAPPPLEPSSDEEDDDGPSLPMNPALA